MARWALGGALALCGGANALQQTTAPVAEVDVIIVGAGWAGMAAADSLARANVSFVVLESTNRTGGRSHAIQFGDPSIWRGTIERGSNWVSGLAPPGVQKGGAAGVAKGMHGMPWENPVYTLARETNLTMVRIPGSADGNMTDYDAIYRSDGDVGGDASGDIRKRAQKALDCVNATFGGFELGVDAHKHKNFSFRDGLIQCGWSPKTEEEFAMDWAMSGEDANGEPARISTVDTVEPDESYQWWGPDDKFVVDQDPRGFAKLVDAMVKDTVPPGDKRVIFDATVMHIDYSSCQHVDVTLSDRRVFRAKHEVISTLPLGVLHRNHTTLFHPPVPHKQAEVMTTDSGFAMGNLTHVVIQFDTVWWDDNLRKWLASNKGSNESAAGGPDGGGPNAAGEFSLWHNLNHANFLPGSHSLLSFLGDPQSARYEPMEDAQVLKAVMDRLALQHPDRNISKPTDFFISRHGTDPNSYGAYSVTFLGWEDRHHKTLRHPLEACGKTRVRLAGEAMCDDLNGYTHGGMQSGRENAAHYLFEQGLGPNPNDNDALGLCNW